MEIGTKIKTARNEANLSQEQAAEALGVSRQTVSNWENGRTYPDINSVIKMSDLYSVSLDHLLKEEFKVKRTYSEYLEESTNIVKSNNKLSKVVLISTYLVILVAAEITLWFFAPGSGYTMVFNIIFLWTLLPLATFIYSFLIGNHNYWGRSKWLVPALLGFILMLVPYSGFSIISSMEVAETFIWPNFGAFLYGTAISMAGVGLGVFCATRKKASENSSHTT